MTSFVNIILLLACILQLYMIREESFCGTVTDDFLYDPSASNPQLGNANMLKSAWRQPCRNFKAPETGRCFDTAM